jgi:hypothetical protein
MVITTRESRDGAINVWGANEVVYELAKSGKMNTVMK